MKARSVRILIGMVLVQLIWIKSPVHAQSPDPSQRSGKVQIPKEPGWKAPAYRGWELVSVPGLIATFYDLDLDGKLDYQVIRKIIRKVSSEEVTIKEAIKLARFDGMAIYVSYPVIYFTSKNPLFYCLGVDYRKNCENIWVDIAEDGLNGNETLYTLSRPNPMVR